MSQKNNHLTKDFLIFDSHCDTANIYLDNNPYLLNRNIAHITPDKIKKGGLNSQFFAIWVNPIYGLNKSEEKALKLYNALEKNLFSSDFGKKVTSISEMQNAIKENKLACWISLEGGHIIENSIKKLENFYNLGIRSMTLTHSKNNDWADSNGDQPKWDGINKLGRKIISKMDEMKISIDVAHSSDKTIEDVLQITSMPIMASHICSRKICNIPRNLPDTLVKEISDKKGFIGVNFFPGFLNKNIYDQVYTNIKKYEKWYIKNTENEKNLDIINKIDIEYYKKSVQGIDSIDLNSIIDHITHFIDVGSIDCVGLGSDFDGIPTTPTNLTDVSCYPELVNGLFEKGLKKEEIRKIMGLNLFNYMKNFEKN